MRRFGVRRVVCRMLYDAWFAWIALAFTVWFVFGSSAVAWVEANVPRWVGEVLVGAMAVAFAASILWQWYDFSVRGLENDEEDREFERRTGFSSKHWRD